MGNPTLFHWPPGRFARSVQFLRVGSSESARDGCRTKGKGRRTVWSSSCWDGTTLCLWRASIRALFCQTMRYPYREPTNPSGPLFLHWDASEEVVVFGHAVSDDPGGAVASGFGSFSLVPRPISQGRRSSSPNDVTM